MLKLINQLIKFGLVGIICFFIDYFLMIVLTELGNVNYLFSSGISFSISVIVNYILSMRFVFKSKEKVNKAWEFFVFVFLSIVGLGLNEVMMWFIVEKMGIFYMLSKIVVTIIVMIYNFITRKIFLEEKRS